MANRAKSKETAAPVGVAIGELNTRYAALTERRNAITAKILVKEAGNYTMFAPVSPETKQQRLDAAKLLNGGFADVVGKNSTEDLTDLHQERKVIDLALGMADVRLQTLLAEEDAERKAAKRDEWIAALSQVAHCLVGLELALQGRDRVWMDMRSRSVIEEHPNTTWRFERLASRAGPAFRFLQNAVAQGWIDEKDFNNALPPKAGQ